jgi:hypothetical protein
MTESLRKAVHMQHDALRMQFHAPLRSIARRAVRVWFNRERLDAVLSAAIGECFQCDLLYAIDTGGRQVSSNVYERTIDTDTYGQDLSLRPYLVTMPQLNQAAFQGAFLCDVYTSQVTQRPCVTVMCGVTSGPATLGFIAADLDTHRLLPLQTAQPSPPLTADLR